MIVDSEFFGPKIAMLATSLLLQSLAPLNIWLVLGLTSVLDTMVVDTSGCAFEESHQHREDRYGQRRAEFAHRSLIELLE